MDRLPDLLTFGPNPDDKTDLKLGLGTKFVQYRPDPVRPDTHVIVSIADLRTVTKESTRLGWSLKCRDVDELLKKLTREIGT